MLSVGSPSQPGIKEAIREYETRLSRYFGFESVIIEARKSGSRDPEQVRAKEGELLLRRIPENLETFALTRTGKAIDSRALADRLGEMATYGRPGAAFVIGGAFGLHSSVIERCDRSMSLSSMTFPHDLARLVLTEQLYRAGTLLRGEPYHKASP
jgi:23S rRNA (pseudouridine1915-N3)-methyltransferase